MYDVRWGDHYSPADCDIVVDGPCVKTVVEYDGAFWHRNRITSDRAKTLALSEDGWRVIRVRENDLGPAFSDDERPDGVTEISHDFASDVTVLVGTILSLMR